jgi:AcrR family transcriptional regulator
MASDRWNATHRRILEAARKAFGRSGYARTNTTEIADAAQVTAKTLFRHFKSKPALFEQAVITPFHAYIDDFVDGRRGRPYATATAEAGVRAFYTDLLSLLDANSGLFIAVVAARAFEDPDSTIFPSLQRSFADQLDRLQVMLATEFEARGWQLDPQVVLPMMFGLVVTMTAHRDFVFSPDGVPTREHLIEQMVGFTVHGISGRTGSVVPRWL